MVWDSSFWLPVGPASPVLGQQKRLGSALRRELQRALRPPLSLLVSRADSSGALASPWCSSLQKGVAEIALLSVGLQPGHIILLEPCMEMSLSQPLPFEMELNYTSTLSRGNLRISWCWTSGLDLSFADPEALQTQHHEGCIAYTPSGTLWIHQPTAWGDGP